MLFTSVLESFIMDKRFEVGGVRGLPECRHACGLFQPAPRREACFPPGSAHQSDLRFVPEFLPPDDLQQRTR